MENDITEIEDKDFVRLQELGCFKNRPFRFPTPKEVFGLLEEVEEEKLKQESCYKTFSLLKDILDIPYIYAKGKGESRRTLLPKDISREQAEILFRNLEKIESLYIKAKIADVLFVSKKLNNNNNRDNFSVAEIAIEAYFNSADYMLCNTGWSKYSFRFRFVSEQVKRASSIMLSLKKRDSLFDKLMGFFKREEFFKEDKSCILITSLGQIICGIKNLSAEKINLALEEYVKIFKIRNPEDTLLGAGTETNIWTTGVKLSKKAKNLNYERYFNKQKGDAHCTMAERFRDSPPHRVNHIKKAILCFREAPEMKDKIEQLEKEPRHAHHECKEQQTAMVSSGFPIPELDLTEPIEELLEKELSGLKFEECLSKLANLCIDCLYENYDCVKETKPKSRLLATKLLDRVRYSIGGKVTYNAESGEGIVFYNLDVLFYTIAPLIKAGLEIINKEHSSSSDILSALIKKSCFIPPHHFDFFNKGLNYFLHNEMLEAVSLLVPQIENSLRYISESPSIVQHDLTEKETIDVFKLFELCAEKKILEEKFKFYLKEILVQHKYSLRHNIAHGQADDTIGNKDSSYVACMLILFLVLKPTGILETKCVESKKLNSMLSKIVNDGINQSLDELSKSLWSS
jgi:hypothetical protein